MNTGQKYAKSESESTPREALLPLSIERSEDWIEKSDAELVYDLLASERDSAQYRVDDNLSIKEALQLASRFQQIQDTLFRAISSAIAKPLPTNE